MKRLQLVEIEDLSWYPDRMRRGQTDFLRWMMGTFKVFEGVWPQLHDLSRQAGKSQWIDLCSGGGGAILQWRDYLRKQGESFKVLLTDLYPNLTAFRYLDRLTQGDCQGMGQSVDATDLPEELDGFLTIFNAFHHFPPAQATAILSHAVDRRLPIAVLEPNDRSVWQLIANTLSLPVLQFLVSPFISPFRWSRLLFTYLLPLIPLVTLWDGWVSVFRTYKPEEMRAMAEKADPEQLFDWHIGRSRHPFGYVNYAFGVPKE